MTYQRELLHDFLLNGSSEQLARTREVKQDSLSH